MGKVGISVAFLPLFAPFIAIQKCPHIPRFAHFSHVHSPTGETTTDDENYIKSPIKSMPMLQLFDKKLPLRKYYEQIVSGALCLNSYSSFHMYQLSFKVTNDVKTPTRNLLTAVLDKGLVQMLAYEEGYCR